MGIVPYLEQVPSLTSEYAEIRRTLRVDDLFKQKEQRVEHGTSDDPHV